MLAETHAAEMEFWRQRLTKEREIVASSMAPTTQGTRFVELERMRNQLRTHAQTRTSRPTTSPGRIITPRGNSVRGRPALWLLPPPTPYTASTPCEVVCRNGAVVRFSRPDQSASQQSSSGGDTARDSYWRERARNTAVFSSHLMLSPRSTISAGTWQQGERVGMMVGRRSGWQEPPYTHR